MRSPPVQPLHHKLPHLHRSSLRSLLKPMHKKPHGPPSLGSYGSTCDQILKPGFVGSLTIRLSMLTNTCAIGLGMFFFLAVVVRIIVSPSLVLLFVSTMYSMFWLPQIIRSARRGRSSAFSFEYLFGTTLCRLYFAFCEICFRSWMCLTSACALTNPTDRLLGLP